MTKLHKHPRTLLVIVAEAALEKPLVREVRQNGGQFWTVTEVHGAGLEGVRDGDWEADRTIELKVICEQQVADQIAQRVLEAYAPHFSVGLYFGEVAVLRPERY
jgi:nitrogen regulatory protein P-II 2